MPFFTSILKLLVILVILCEFLNAKAVQQKQTKRHSVPLRRHLHSDQNKNASLVPADQQQKLRQKHQQHVQRNVKNFYSTASSHSKKVKRFAIDATPTTRIGYVAEVGIGDAQSEQIFRLLLDTGSSNIAVPSIRCVSEGCLQRARYDESHSLHAQRGEIQNDGELYDNSTITINFATGELKGIFFSDRFCLQAQLCFQQQQFVAIEAESEEFDQLPFDGLLGLGRPALSATFAGSLLNSLFVYKGITQYALALRSRQELIFGSLTEQEEANVQYFKNAHPDYWAVQLEAIFVADHCVLRCHGHCLAIFDTGTNVITGPREVVHQMYQIIGLVEDCSYVRDRPSITLQFEGGLQYTLDAEDYFEIEQQTQPKNQQEQLTNICFPLITDLDCDLGSDDKQLLVFVLGEPFFRKYLTVYNFFDDKVGVGEYAEN